MSILRRSVRSSSRTCGRDTHRARSWVLLCGLVGLHFSFAGVGGLRMDLRGHGTAGMDSVELMGTVLRSSPSRAAPCLPLGFLCPLAKGANPSVSTTRVSKNPTYTRRQFFPGCLQVCDSICRSPMASNDTVAPLEPSVPETGPSQGDLQDVASLADEPTDVSDSANSFSPAANSDAIVPRRSGSPCGDWLSKRQRQKWVGLAWIPYEQ